MIKEYSAEENKAWRATQPQKMVVVKVIIKSDRGNILLVKPNYKKTWQLPGGGVDNGESPESAVVREVSEELNLAISIDDISLKGTIYKPDEEILFLIYESNELLTEDTQFKVQADEIIDYQFVNPETVPELLSDYYADFWKRQYS